MTKTGVTKKGFFAKLVRFIRHPTTDWSDLDQRTQGMDAEREMLKAAVQRKRRNDKVRNTELDVLRQAMLSQRQPESSSTTGYLSDDGGTSSAVASSLPIAPADASKARTIEQIARIEQQMSQNWLRRRQEGGPENPPSGESTTILQPPSRPLTVPAHLGVDRWVSDSERMPIDVLGSDPNAMVGIDTVLAHPAIADAGVRFASGDVDGAEQCLRQLMVQEPMTVTARWAGLALLDVLHARRSLDGFEEFAAEYAERFGVPVPRWPADAKSSPSRVLVSDHHEDDGSAPVWICPLFLDMPAVENLCRVMHSPGQDKWLDWTGLLSADAQAAHALKLEVDQWVERPLNLHVAGGAVLRRRLKASTPSGRRENEPVWWWLRLGLLRVMGRQDEFELASLDYCVTYGVAPPPWQSAVCRFEAVEAVPGGQSDRARSSGTDAWPAKAPSTGGTDALEWPAMVTTIQGLETLFPPAHTHPASDWTTTLPAVSGASVRLKGYLAGDMTESIGALSKALAGHAPGKLFVIDCQLLERIDLVAAGTLLEWLTQAMGRGVAVELRGVSRLVAAFFHVVGIAASVPVRLRQY